MANESKGKKKEQPKSTKKEARNVEPKTVGKWLFIAGLVLAVVYAFLPADQQPDWLEWILLLVGIVAGWLRVSKESEVKFLVLALALIFFSGALDALPTIGELITAILEGVTIFIGAAVVSVIARNMWGWLT